MVAWVLALMSAVMLQQPVAETGTITGRVVDEATRRPIARAVVVLAADRRLSGVRQIADQDGRFAFDHLAPGTYRVSASAGEFRATYVPSWRRSGGLVQVRLEAGQTREISFRLTRALALSGRVVDQAGLPLSRVRIRLRHLETGQMVHSPGLGTDDLGSFRMFGLAPGRYVVCAESNVTPAFGRRAADPPERFVQTCYPSAPDEAAAQVVRLTFDDVDGVEIRMLRQRIFTLSGQVIDANGAAPSSFFLMLMRVERLGASGSGHRFHGSTFTVTNVVPGRYVFHAELGRELTSPSSRPDQLGFTFVDVTSDVENVLITTRTPATVRGSITFEDGVPPDFDPSRLRVDLQPPGTGWPTAGTRDVGMSDDHTFTLPHVYGPQVLYASGLPAGAAVRSMLYRGRDILERATEFTDDPRDHVEIVVTSRVAELTGRVLDHRGEAVAGSRIYLFPADPDRWVRPFAPRTATTASSGMYRIRDLAPGDYLVVAISAVDQQDIQASDWFRPTPHERLSKLAEQVSLLDSERRVLDLRLTPIPQDWKR